MGSSPIRVAIFICGRGGTADALVSGTSRSDPVVVQIHSTAPNNFIIFNMRMWRNWQTHHLEGVAGLPRVSSNLTIRTTKNKPKTIVGHGFIFLLFKLVESHNSQSYHIELEDPSTVLHL